MKNQIEAFEDGDLKTEDVKKIAKDLGVSEDDVISLNRRMAMGGDPSLNVPLREEGEGQWQDWLVDTQAQQDERDAHDDEYKIRHQLLVQAMVSLTVCVNQRTETRTLASKACSYGKSRGGP